MSLWRVRTEFTGSQGAPYLNTLYFDTLGGTAGQAVAAAGTFWGAVDAQIANDLSWATEAEVYQINEATGQPVSVTQVTPVTGTGAKTTEMISRAAQGLIRFGTGVFIDGRELRGRVFVPGLTTDALDNGQMDAGVVGILDAAAAALLIDANSAIVVYSRKNATFEGVISSSTWTQFAVLRSRRD